MSRVFTSNPALSTIPDYVGPGDVVSGAAGFWSLRAYTRSGTGRTVARIRRLSDNAQQDFSPTGSGLINTEQVLIFKIVSSTFIVRLYDQIGAIDYVQNTGPQMPFHNQTTIGLGGNVGLGVVTRPSTFEFDSGSSRRLTTSATESFSQPQTIVSAFFPRSTGSGGLWGNTSMTILSEVAGSNNLNINAGTTLTASSVNINQWHTLIVTFNGASSEIYIDGAVVASGDAGSNNVSALSSDIGAAAGANFSDSVIAEIIRYPFVLTSTQKASLSINMRSFWGFGE